MWKLIQRPGVWQLIYKVSLRIYSRLLTKLWPSFTITLSIRTTTSVDTHGNQALELRKGVCQDFAHAALILCRCLGIPARYVSGYFFDRTRDQTMRGSEASHAWIEVLVNGFGWYGLDPTNNQVVDENYIVLGTGLDYKDVAPVTGSYFGKLPKSMEVSVTVKRLDGSID